jgi:prolyl oligopeptidase
MKFTLLLIPALAISSLAQAQLTYPATKKVDQVDDYFGTKVEDPYRWLEDDNAPETKDWVTAQNKVTFDYLDKIPYRTKIKNRLTELYNYERFSMPSKVGEYYIFSKNDGLQNQAVYYRQKGLDGAPEVLLDPNAMSKEGTTSVGLAGSSKDKKNMAYTVSKAGSDWQEIFVKDVATGKDLDDKLEWVKFSGAAWKGDGFYYSRYDKPAPGQELSKKNEYQKVYYHKLGTTQDKDSLIFQDTEHPLRYFGASTTEDERFLIIDISEGTDGNQIIVKDLNNTNKPKFRVIVQGFDSHNAIIDNVGDKLLLMTDIDAPNYKLVLVDPNNPGKENWKTIIPERPELLQSVTTSGKYLIVTYLKDVTSKVYQYNMDGIFVREVKLPTVGTASGFYAEKDQTVAFYGFTSINYPFTIFKYNLNTGRSEVYKKPNVKFNPEDFEVTQVFYTSKDGTKVPMFIAHKKGIKLDGNNTALLYGYGGFSVNIQPSFSAANIVLMENGGVYAVATLRGGGEYGENWHKNGMLLKKQNVFDDFISAGEYLVKNGYTSPSKLGIEGRSNGGLLVGACMTQRPDLFKVAFPGVGVMDMLRFQKFTVGWGWVDEYGSSEANADEFKNLYSFSPLHNLKPGTSYPATMVTTADHDDRVVPAHSFKFASRLQECHKGPNPVLIRIETNAGHGAGKSLTKIIEERADIWSFLFYNTGADIK